MFFLFFFCFFFFPSLLSHGYPFRVPLRDCLATSVHDEVAMHKMSDQP